MITHSWIRDLLLPWVCLPRYPRQRQDQSNENINSPRDWSRIVLKFGKKHVIHQFNQNFRSAAKVNFDSANFVISHAVERGEWVLLWLDGMQQEIGFWSFYLLQKIRSWKVDKKWAYFLVLFIQVLVHKMSKMIHFANVYAAINKKYRHLMVLRSVKLKDLIALFQKMV